MELQHERARSFGPTAAAYAEHRPDYPADAIRWGLAAADGPPRRVLDLGAGTGKLTGGLLALGSDLEVTAVEPDELMRTELTARFPSVRALAGSAERIPLASGSVDAVVVGQAFHWFDREQALPEIARVLRPGGALAALWNDEDTSVEWVAGFAEAARTWVSIPTVLRTSDYPLFESADFGACEREPFAHTQRRTADSLTATMGTRSHTLVVSEAQRAEVLGRVRDYLASRPETASGEFDVPLVTTVVRARRH
jgi:SAM-dependent methyltransferase